MFYSKMVQSYSITVQCIWWLAKGAHMLILKIDEKPWQLVQTFSVGHLLTNTVEFTFTTTFVYSNLKEFVILYFYHPCQHFHSFYCSKQYFNWLLNPSYYPYKVKKKLFGKNPALSRCCAATEWLERSGCGPWG